MIFRILFISLFFLLNIKIYSQSKEYKANLKKLFQYTSLDKSLENSIEDMLIYYKKQNKTVPEKIWKEINDELSFEILDYFVQLFAPVYFKQINEKDLENIINFYETPSGKIYAKSSLNILKETTILSEEWAYNTHSAIGKKLTDLGYIKYKSNELNNK